MNQVEIVDDLVVSRRYPEIAFEAADDVVVLEGLNRSLVLSYE